MIAVLNPRPKKCPETLAICESARCAIDMCQRLKEKKLTDIALPGKAGARPEQTVVSRNCPRGGKCAKHSCNSQYCLKEDMGPAKARGDEDAPYCLSGGGQCKTPNLCDNVFQECLVDREARMIREREAKPVVKVPAVSVHICHLDDTPCDSATLSRCKDCKAPVKVAPAAAPPAAIKRNTDGSAQCPVLKASCWLDDCCKGDRCSLQFSLDKPPPQYRECPVDVQHPCKSEWCVSRNKCALQNSPSGAPTYTYVATPKGTTVTSTDCHKGVYKLGIVGHATIWAGREAATSRICPGTHKRYALIICLIEGSSREPGWLRDSGVVSGNDAAAALIPGSVFRSGEQVPFLHIQWPDFSTPPLDRAWWDSFMVAIGRVKGDVLLYCQGGHGRTGTALSIIAVLGDWVRKDQCPVTWVRANYCRNCVESESQADYIERMTGSRVFANGSKGGYAGGGQYTFLDKPKGEVRPASQAKAAPAKAAPQTLSKNAFKKWAKEERRKGLHIPTLGELDDLEMVIVDGRIFQWNKPDQRFEYKGIYNSLPDADLEPERPDPAG